MIEQLAAQARAGHAHDGVPQGVPVGYPWAAHSVIDAGAVPPEGFTAMLGWLQAFREGANRGASLLQLANMQTWTRVGDAWTLLQQAPVFGQDFAPDYVNNGSPQKLIRCDDDDGMLQVRWRIGRAFHGWHNGRALVPSRMDEVLVIVQARCVGEPVLVGGGCDYWRDLTCPWNGDGVDNRGAGVGRLHRVGALWQWVTFSSTKQ